MTSTDASISTTDVKDVEKPHRIHVYNQNMNGFDRMDQKATYYSSFDRKTVKWWKKLFLWLHKLAQVNSLILYNFTREETAKPYPLKRFKQDLLRQLARSAADSLTGERPRQVRPPSQSPMEPL